MKFYFECKKSKLCKPTTIGRSDCDRTQGDFQDRLNIAIGGLNKTPDFTGVKCLQLYMGKILALVEPEATATLPI